MNHSNEKETKENHPKKVSFNYNVEQLPSNSEGLPTGYTCYICKEGACENCMHEELACKFFYDPDEDKYICAECFRQVKNGCYICGQKMEQLFYHPGEDEYMCEECIKAYNEDEDSAFSSEEDECMQIDTEE